MAAAVALLVLAVALWTAAIGLWAWAEHLDGEFVVRAYQPAKLGGCPIEFDRWSGVGRERCVP